MKLYEAAQLLATVQSFNNRTVGESDVVAWHSVLSDVELADAEEAVRRHYSEHTDWMMPAHIRRIVRDIERERATAATVWAPGQYGVPKDKALPEITRGVRLTADDVSPDVLDILSQLRAVLPDVPRERLFPRKAEWDRQQAAFARQTASEPNPHYRPLSVDDRLRAACRAEGSHDAGRHIEGCPDGLVEGTCSTCGCESEDLAGHRRDYPAGSCA